jgi:hypothetical protein
MGSNLGEVTGFAQVTRPYSLRYTRRKAFNENGKSRDLVYARYVVHDVVHDVVLT